MYTWLKAPDLLPSEVKSKIKADLPLRSYLQDTIDDLTDSNLAVFLSFFKQGPLHPSLRQVTFSTISYFRTLPTSARSACSFLRQAFQRLWKTGSHSSSNGCSRLCCFSPSQDTG